MTTRQVAIITGPDTHLDHLGVLCHLLDIPLIVTENSTYTSALSFYPQISVTQKNLNELSAHFLAENFDVLFESGKFWAAELTPIFRLLYRKNMRFVFCPHGNSDKGHSAKEHIEQDISLVYGKHMIDLLTQTGAIKKIKSTLVTGNYRLPFYLKYQSFYDNLVEKHIFKNLDKNKKTALYAPTWQDGENPSSFFEETAKLIESCKANFNLIIKLHPFLEKFHPAETFRVISFYENTPNVIFLNQFPPIYPLLNAVDFYIGDYSSIGYDFLAFDKPLYFLTKKTAKKGILHSCGLAIPSSKDALEFIQKTFTTNQEMNQPIRKSTYLYAFGEEKPFSKLKQELLEIINEPLIH